MDRIAIIDTGVNTNHPKLNGLNITNYLVEVIDGDVLIKKGGNDLLGHGTAICGIICEHCPDIEIISFQLFMSDINNIDSEDLYAVLKYVHSHFDVSLIHLSIGCQMCSNLNELKQLCHDIVESGTTIVSAFDNDGTMSYPASIDCVIGVDWSAECKRKDDIIYIENSPVNVLGKGINQRVLWSQESDYMIVSGSSFAAAHVTGIIVKERTNNKNALAILKEKSVRVLTMPYSEETPKAGKYGKIGLFPFNKEIESILCFHKQLRGTITHIFDSRFFGRVGQAVKKYIYLRDEINLVIENIDNLEQYLPEIDTMVIGFTSEIQNTVGINYKDKILELCQCHNVKCFCLGVIPEHTHYKQIYSPTICQDHIRKNTFQKLRIIGTPILMIAGTSSKQGKFSLQLMLRDYFEKKNYIVGQWATEPQAQLFGIDEVLPAGYGSALGISETELIEIINYQIGLIEDKKCDIIISGTQSFQLPYNLIHANMYPSYQNAIISALQADAILLCVNFHDETDYILRTIKYIEAVTMGKVIGLIVYPIKRKQTWSASEYVSIHVSKEELDSCLKKLKEKTHIDVFCLEDIEDIGNAVIQYFE